MVEYDFSTEACAANSIADRLRGRAKPTGVKATGPTPRNLDVLAFMREFWAENDQLPPMTHIAHHFWWVSTQAAQCHVDALAHHGMLERNVCGKYRFARGASKQNGVSA